MRTSTQFSDIEQAIIDKISAEMPEMKMVASIADYIAVDWEKLRAITPSAFVSYDGSTFDPNSLNGLCVVNAQFSVLIVQNLLAITGSATTTASGGNLYTQGYYELLANLWNTIAYQDFGLDISPMNPVKEEAQSGDELTSVVKSVFTTSFRITI